MRFCNVVLLLCLASAVLTGTEPATAAQVELSKKLATAIQLERQGDLKRAEKILLDLIRDAEESNTNKFDLAIIFNNLAVQYSVTDRHEDAEKYFKESIGILEKLPDEEAGQVLTRTKLHLATMYIEAGRVRDAVKLDVPTLVNSLRDREDQVRARSVIASLSVARDEFDAAEKDFLEILAFWTDPSRKGGDQVEIATVLNNLGAIALWQGKTDLARERLEQSLRLWRSIAGPTSPVVIKSIANIASAYMEEKRYDDAAAWLARAISDSRSSFGELHPFVVAMQFTHAEALKKAGRKDEAKQVARAAEDARAMSYSPSTSGYTVDYRELFKRGWRRPR